MIVVLRGKVFQIWCKSSDFFACVQVKYFFAKKYYVFFVCVRYFYYLCTNLCEYAYWAKNKMSLLGGDSLPIFVV